MDERALEGLSPFANREQQARAAAYFEQIKQVDDGWKVCADAIMNQRHTDHHVQFFCFQVLEHFIKCRYIFSSEGDQLSVRQLLISWLQVQTVSGTEEKLFMKNKVAQLFSLVFVQDYPHRWPTFFNDLLQMLQIGPKAIDMYLRVLMAIDSEVVDRDIVHTFEESHRNTTIKDTMRDDCVPALVDSWYQILTTYETQNAELTCLCLEVVGAYVSWININLVANERFIQRLLHHLTIDMLKESACDTFHEIIKKGMDPQAKMELVELVTDVLQRAGIIPPSEDEDCDFLAKLSDLTNGIGCNLISCWQRFNKAGEAENATKALGFIENKLPLMFGFLAHEDDDISLAAIDFAKDYVGLLKQLGPAVVNQHLFGAEKLLEVIFKKFEYDNSYNFESQGEDEVMFLDYRKQLKILFENLAQLNTDVVLNGVHNLVRTTLCDWKNQTFTKCELAIRMLYIIGECITANQGSHFPGEASKTTPLKDMMTILITCGVANHSHWAVSLQYFETISRYEKYFTVMPGHIPQVLSIFLDERGMRHNNPTIRSRTAYLFCRFVKQLRNHIGAYAEDILQRIQDLLTIVSPVNGHQCVVTSDDQLYLYEAAGIIIIASSLPVEKKQLLMNNLLSTTIDKFNTMYEKLCKEQDEAQQNNYAQIISHTISCVSRSSKAFHREMTMKQSGLVNCYVGVLKVFLCALETPYQHQIIHSAVRQFFHRMIVCLGDAVLAFIPSAVDHLLKKGDAKDIHDFMPLINQIVSKFKKTIIPFLQEAFMPIVQRIFEGLSQPTDELDTTAKQDKQALQRSYFQFLQSLITHDVMEVISNQNPENFKQVLLTVVQAAVDSQDPMAQKLCFVILKKLTELWGGKNGMPAFREYTYDYIIPACFMAPIKVTFDLSDAQTVLALGEISAVLKVVYSKEVNDMLQFLQHKYFPTLPLPPEIGQAFCNAISEMDPKIFKDYFKHFMETLKKT